MELDSKGGCSKHNIDHTFFIGEQILFSLKQTGKKLDVQPLPSDLGIISSGTDINPALNIYTELINSGIDDEQALEIVNRALERMMGIEVIFKTYLIQLIANDSIMMEPKFVFPSIKDMEKVKQYRDRLIKETEAIFTTKNLIKTISNIEDGFFQLNDLLKEVGYISDKCHKMLEKEFRRTSLGEL
jgi:hypothetical protein